MRPFTAGRYKSTLNLPLTARVMLRGDTAEGLACPMPTSAGDSPCAYNRTSGFWLFSWLSGDAHLLRGQEKQMGCSGYSTEEGWAGQQEGSSSLAVDDDQTVGTENRAKFPRSHAGLVALPRIEPCCPHGHQTTLLHRCSVTALLCGLCFLCREGCIEHNLTEAFDTKKKNLQLAD